MADKTESIKLVKELSRKEMTFAIAPVEAGRKMLLGSADFHVYEVDFGAEKPEPRSLGQHESYVTGLAVTNGVAISSSYDGTLIWWNLATSQKIRTVNAHGKWVRKVVASPDGKTIASVGDDMIGRIWDAETGKKRHELVGHAVTTPTHYPSMLFTCAFSPDSKHLATADKLGQIRVWDVASGKTVATLEAPIMYTWDPVQRRHSIGGIRALAFSPDGTKLAAGGIGKIGNIDHLEGMARVEVFDWKTGKHAIELSNDSNKGIIERLIFHPSGTKLLALGGANDGFVQVIDLNAKNVPLSEKLTTRPYDATYDPASKLLTVSGHNKVADYALTW